MWAGSTFSLFGERRVPYAAALVLRDAIPPSLRLRRTGRRLSRNNPGLWSWVPAQGRDDSLFCGDVFASLAMTASKRLAEKSRTLQPISPGQLDRFLNPDPQPRPDRNLADPRMKRDRRGVECEAIVLIGDAERLGQLARSRAQRPPLVQSAPAAHRGKAVGRLQGADQDRAGGAFLLADEIDAPMDAVGAVDIGKTGRAEHHPVARRRPAERMRGRLGVS